ncbi:signal peptidase I [Nocardioides gansuensis]|uniref:Signal peptidase I n=1 Tax=Nocardioides gansuensis TaxID=2138300 RepID=A0A2T8F771_9ACTN|nr:signal peptidase I [Nocardioides gansuensis]
MLLAALCACALSVQSFSSAAFTSTSRATSTVTAASDWTPPSVSVTSPSTGQIVAGQVTVTAAASDARSAVASVRIDVAVAGSPSWQPLCTDSTAPYSCAWSTTSGTYPDGDHDLRATATDTVGLSATSAAVTTRVANSAGVVLGSVPSAFRSTLVLEATVVGTGLVPATTLSFQYRMSPSGSWTTITGCTRSLVTTATCTWAPTGAAEVYDVRAVAVVGATTYTDNEAAIQFDPTPPTVMLTVPAGTVYGTAQLTATATDDGSGVAGIVFEYRRTGTAGWTACGTDSEPAYTCALNTTTLVNGATYEFRATATDVAGNATTTPEQSRVVDNREATVAITGPGGGDALRGTVAVTADAFAPVAPTSLQTPTVHVEVRPAGGGVWTVVCTDPTAPYACPWDTTTVAAGSYELRAVLDQPTGPDVVSAVVLVTVDNSPLRAVDVAATNGGTSGYVDAGDQMVLTYSADVALGTVKAGWTGAATPVNLTFEDKSVAGGAIAGHDRVRFADAHLGQVAFVQDYVRANRTVGFTGTMTASTVVVDGVTVTVVAVTIGAPTGSNAQLRSSTVTGAMRWTPSASATTPTGSACSVAPATETGARDKDL